MACVGHYEIKSPIHIYLFIYLSIYEKFIDNNKCIHSYDMIDNRSCICTKLFNSCDKCLHYIYKI